MWPFNTAKAADDILDKDSGLLSQAGGWIGGQQFTKQEQSIANAKVLEAGVAFVASTASESTERSKARRSTALGWIRLQVFAVLATLLAAPLDMELAKFYFNLATSELMLYCTFAIMCFFFGPYMLSAHMGGVVSRVRETASKLTATKKYEAKP